MTNPLSFTHFITKALASLRNRSRAATAPGPADIFRGAAPVVSHAPYWSATYNLIYNRLFCDDPDAFRGPGSERFASGPWAAVLAHRPDAAALRRIGEDRSPNTRIRLLAFLRLRQMAEPIPLYILGAVWEFRVNGGLDVLAAYADGSVEYINHTEAMSVFEGASLTDEIADQVDWLFRMSEDLVNETGPWETTRPAPPSGESTRITYLTSGGPYVVDGNSRVLLEQDATSPAANALMDLFEIIVETSIEQRKPDLGTF
jgi:hypothetical protein